jgi:hypothetical protein
MLGHGGTVTWIVKRDSSDLGSSPKTRRDLNRKTLNVFATPPFRHGGLSDDGRFTADLRRTTNYNHTQRNYRRSPATGTATRLCASMHLLTYCVACRRHCKKRGHPSPFRRCPRSHRESQRDHAYHLCYFRLSRLL